MFAVSVEGAISFLISFPQRKTFKFRKKTSCKIVRFMECEDERWDSEDSRKLELMGWVWMGLWSTSPEDRRSPRFPIRLCNRLSQKNLFWLLFQFLEWDDWTRCFQRAVPAWKWFQCYILLLLSFKGVYFYLGLCLILLLWNIVYL